MPQTSPVPAPASASASAPAPAPSAHLAQSPGEQPSFNPKPMLAVLIIASLIASYNENNVNVALPQIMAEFGIDAVIAQWLVSGYMVVTACVAASSAFLYVRLGARRVFLLTAGFLIVGLTANLLAPVFPLLFASRLLQAIGTGLSIPMMMSTILLLAPEHQRGTYMAVGTGVVTLGPALAPVIGGVLVNTFGWRATVLVPLIGIVATAIAGYFFVKTVTPTQKSQMDVLSVALAALGLFAFTWGLSVITTQTVQGIAGIVAFLALAGLFARRQLRIDNPLLDLTPVRNMKFAPVLLLVMVDMISTFSLSVLLPLYYQQGCALDASASGLLLLGPLLVNGAFCFASGKMLDRWGTWPVIPLGFLFIVIGQGIMALIAGTGEVSPVLIASFLSYMGVGLSMTACQVAGCSAVRPQEYPAASALCQIFVMIAAAAGPPLFTGIMEGVAHGQIANGVIATLANAEGFSSAMVVATAIAVVGCIVSAVYSWRMRKR